jgi:hypothetical protein
VGTTTTWLAIGGVLAAVLVLVLPAYVTLVRLRRAHAATLARLDLLECRHREVCGQLDQLSARLHERTASAPGRRRDDDGVLVAEAIPGSGGPDLERPRPVADQLVLSATLGEPLLRAAAFGHGVRRALSAESRNRIRFEVRREVRRSRKQRRRDMKAAYRHVQRQAEAGEA